MKIKIRIKTLILLILVVTIGIVWLIPNTFLMIARSLENNSPDKASVFYEKYANYPTTFSIKGDYHHAKSLINGFGKFTKYFNSWGGGDDKSPEYMDKARLVLENIMKKSPIRNEDQYYIDSYKMLLDLAIARGDAGLLENWISFGQNSDKDQVRYFADLYSAFLLHINGDRDGAKEILESLEREDFDHVNLDILKAEIALFEGNYKESEKLYEDIENQNWTVLHSGNFGSQGYYGRRDWFDWVFNDLKGDNIIRGTVTYEGKPLPFMEIYVQAADGGMRTSGETYIGISDENGNFQTLGLKDGVYNIGIGIDGSLLTDKVLYSSASDYFELEGRDGEIHFELKDTLNVTRPEGVEEISEEEFAVSWEEVEGADHYIVEIIGFSEPYEKGGPATFRFPAYDKNGEIKHIGTSARINIELQKNELGGYGREEEGLITPNAILGIFLPNAEYPIVVNAYDEEKNLITSSLPLRTYYDKIPSIKVKGSFSEGEGLILNQDYLDAIDYYENFLKENPDDIDALRYLTKIYGIGWKYGEKNIQRAIELGTRFTDVTGNRRLLYNIVGWLDIDEIKEYPELYKSLVLEDENFYDPSYYYRLSNYHIAMEDWENARDALRQEEEGYTNDDLIYLNMYFGEYGEAADTAKYSYNHNLSSEKFTRPLKDLDNNPPNSKDKEILDDFLLELVSGLGREEGKAIYNEIMDEISNRTIRVILKEIYLSRAWDIEDDY